MQNNQYKKNTKHLVLGKIFLNSLVAYILADIATVIGPLVDGAIIANYIGVEAVAAVGLFGPLLTFIAIIGSIIAGGSRGLYADLVGRGEIEKANSLFTLACIMALVFSLMTTIFGLVFAENVAVFLGARGSNASLKPLLTSYIRGVLPGVTFISLSKVLSGFMHLDHDSERTVYSLVIMTIVDILADLFVVFVIKGDLFGIALATSIGNIVWFLVMSAHFFRKERLLRFKHVELKSATKDALSILNTGSGAAVIRTTKMLATLTVNYMLIAFSNTIAIAAYSVHKSVISLLGCMYVGVADTVWVMSGIYYGEEDRNSLDELQLFATSVGVKMALVVGTILFIFAKYLAGVYIGFGNPEALSMGTESVRMFAISLPLFVITFSFADYLISVKRIKTADFYAFMLQYGNVIPVTFILIQLIGGRGAWVATPFASFLSLILGYVLIANHKEDEKRFNVKRLLLKKEFGSNSNKEIDITAETKLEVSGMSRIANLFCKENNIESTTAFKLSLCIEEIGMNIINHGFRTNKKNAINMRVVVKNDELIIRIRDNCKPFNPLERYKMQVKDNADPMKNIGIRIVMGMCSSVNYICTFNTNNLIMKIPISG